MIDLILGVVFIFRFFSAQEEEISKLLCLSLSFGFNSCIIWVNVSQCMRALVKLPQSVTVAFLCVGFEQEDLLLNKS